MDVLRHNGSGVVAMTGKNCIAIASDRRFGSGFQTIATDMNKIFKIHNHLFVGISGLLTDVQTVERTLRFNSKLYNLREERLIKPKPFAALLSSLLYDKRFGPYFVEPIVVGLDNGTPFLCAMDLLGAQVSTADFLVAGSCSEQLYGMCEAVYRPNMNEDELFETISQCLLAAVDRDALSGWGGIVHIISPSKVVTKEIRCRQD